MTPLIQRLLLPKSLYLKIIFEFYKVSYRESKAILFLFMLFQRVSITRAHFFSPVDFTFEHLSSFIQNTHTHAAFTAGHSNKSLENDNSSSSASSSSIITVSKSWPLEPKWNHPLVGILLITMTLITIFGNSLVIFAVVRERHLKSATNYYIASLAVADLLVGLVVMPFNSLNKMTDDFWFFGDLWCDIWHSFDVFASTASINSLLFIALDRHSAISDPISYHTRWLTRYWILFVALIWICSAFISFPAIAYWRSVTTEYVLHRCVFPDDIFYLIFSSLVSFYIPLIIMVVVYVRIYRAATNQMNAIKTGQKLNVKTTGDGSPLTLRIHRGGYHKLSKVETNYGATLKKAPTISNFNEHSRPHTSMCNILTAGE